MTHMQMEKICTEVGLSGFFSVERVGLSGGLLFMWQSNWHVLLVGSSAGHMDVSVCSPDRQFYRVTGFYGNPIPQLRSHSWELLRRLSTSIQGGWLVVGDFNELLDVSEKTGLCQRSSIQIGQFRDVLVDCGLSSIPFVGHSFTWSNYRAGDDFVEERLDRGLVNDTFLLDYPHVLCHHLVNSVSDHKALLFDVFTDNEFTAQQSRKRRRFHFEEFGLVILIVRGLFKGHGKGLMVLQLVLVRDLLVVPILYNVGIGYILAIYKCKSGR